MNLNRYCVRLPVSIAHVFALDINHAHREASNRYGGYSDIWLDEDQTQEQNEQAEREEFDAWRAGIPQLVKASAKIVNGAWLAWKERATRATWLSTPRIDFEMLGISLMTKAQRSQSYERWQKLTASNK